MIEQLPADLAALIAAERAAPTASSAVRIAVRAKVAAAVAGAPLGVAATSLGIGKVIAIVALTVGAGTAAVVGAKTHRSHPEVARATPVVEARHVDPPAPLVEQRPDVPADAHPPALVHATTPVVRSRAVARGVVPSQAERIRRAWDALSSGDPSGALAVADRDTVEHPSGVLSEERDAVEIVALARVGRLDEATRAAGVFRSRYPTSIHLELIARSLGKRSR